MSYLLHYNARNTKCTSNNSSRNIYLMKFFNIQFVILSKDDLAISKHSASNNGTVNDSWTAKDIICVVQRITHLRRNSTRDLSEKRQKYWSVRRYDRLLFKTQQVRGWVSAVPLYAFTHNQQFRRCALNFANFAVTLQSTLWTFPHISSFTSS